MASVSRKQRSFKDSGGRRQQGADQGLPATPRHGALPPATCWQRALEKVRRWARVNSPWLLHYNSGSCNGCDIEIVATLTPRYDVERFGALLEGSPRHADILICTGPVTLQSRQRLRRIYEQMPGPKYVMAVGSCALSGGVFQGCYNVVGSVDAVLPVDVYVPGCPPRPQAIIDGLIKLLGSIQDAHVEPRGEESW